MPTPHEEVAQAIVDAQARLVGDVALDMARRVPEIEIDDLGYVSITGDATTALDGLVHEYTSLTGALGVRMCHDAAKTVLDMHPHVVVPSLSEVRKSR